MLPGGTEASQGAVGDVARSADSDMDAKAARGSAGTSQV